MAVVLDGGSPGPGPSTAAVIRQGWGRLWARGVFAVVATWALVTLVSIAVVAPAWAWWSGALSHTIDGARLLGSPNASTFAELLRESPFGFRTIAQAALAGAALAVLLNPFLAGGLIGALSRAPRRDAAGGSMPTAALPASRRTACAATDRCSASR
jgi:hypothetical protein